jgi:hypothetical protein
MAVGVGLGESAGDDRERTPFRKIRHQFRGCRKTILVTVVVAFRRR